jgi:hypothetical protein
LKEQATKKTSVFQQQKALINKLMEKMKKGEEVSSKYMICFFFVFFFSLSFFSCFLIKYFICFFFVFFF